MVFSTDYLHSIPNEPKNQALLEPVNPIVIEKNR